MTSSLKNKMPAWDFRSSYGSLSSPAYRKACQRLEADIHILAGLVPNAKDSAGRTHQKLSNEPRYRSPFIGDLTRGTF